jgi:two-component system, cell cycle response regulator
MANDEQTGDSFIHQGRVLIVDDDKNLLKFIRAALESEGYQCETAMNPLSALELVGKESFDIMITDIVLPEMNGLELTKKAKNLKPRMAIIIATGYIDAFSYDEAIEAGASDFLKKPFTVKELTARAKHVKIVEEMRNLALRDELTGLYNRRGFFTLIEHQLKLAKRKKTGMFLLYADLDDLKSINDTWGHREGDAALIETAKILRKNYRESDIIARIGGDEFVVFPAGTSDDDSEKILDRLYNAFLRHRTQSNPGYKLSISAGVSLYHSDAPCSIDELLALGDKSMYERKVKKFPGGKL